MQTSVLRGIIGKCINKRIENNLRLLSANTKVCLSKKSAIEYALHSLRSQYGKTSHSTPSDFYVADKTLQSLEFTIQGGSIAMVMYGGLRLVQNTQVSQNWYEDKGSAVGSSGDLLLFCKQLTEHGSCFRYSMNAPKCQLIVKEESKIKALRLLEGTTVEIVDGCSVLGSVLGNEKTYENFNVTTAGKTAIGALSKNIPSERIHMPHKKRKKIEFRVPNNTKLTENPHRSRSQKPNARPTSFFDFVVSQSARRLYSLPTRRWTYHQGVNRLRNGVRCFADRKRSS